MIDREVARKAAFAYAKECDIGGPADKEAEEAGVDEIVKIVGCYLTALASQEGARQCAALRAGSSGGNDPQDCDWPVCGCDPDASKVIAALEESGHLIAKKRAEPIAYITRVGLADWCRGTEPESHVLLRKGGDLRVALYTGPTASQEGAQAGEVAQFLPTEDGEFNSNTWEGELTPEELEMIDQAWENHKAALPVATVINDNQPGWTAIIETAPNVTLPVGTKLYAEPKVVPHTTPPAPDDAVRAAVEAEREVCAKTAEGSSREFDFQSALAECRDNDVGYHSGRIVAAGDIRARKGGAA